MFDASKQGVLMFIFDSNQDGQITYDDVGEWLNPLPFDMPSTRMNKGTTLGGLRDDYT